MDKDAPDHVFLTPELIERFSRQILVKDIGVSGLKKLRSSRVVVIGCGATGTAQAELLARLGIGYIRVVDKDYVDISNLPRTHLYTYIDAKQSIPKAIACANRLSEIDPTIHVEPVITRVTPDNIEDLVRDVDLIIDGTDNLATRFLINDVSIKYGIPWIFVGFSSWYGQVFFINPGKGPCLDCIIPRRILEREERGDACEVLGAVNTAIALVSSIAATLALKHLLGILNDYNTLYVVNGKRLEIHHVRIERNMDCPTCIHRRFEFLAKKGSRRGATRICGSNAVEITPPVKTSLNLEELSKRYEPGKILSVNKYTMRIMVDDIVSIILFNDGRAIIDGVNDEEYAWKLYRRYVLDKMGLGG